MKYRLVQLKYGSHSEWVIEERPKLFSFMFTWVNVQEGKIFHDYALALEQLKMYRLQWRKAKRIILDV